MKAVVVEIRDGKAALLQDDGRIVMKKDTGLRKGDVIEMNEKTKERNGGWRKLALVAAMCLVLIGTGAVVYNTPYYHVSLDVNPGIGLEANRFGRVIGIEAANEDAVKIVKGLEAKHEKLEDAIAEAIDLLDEEGYFEDGEGEIMLAAIAKNEAKAEKVAANLEKIVSKQLEQKNKKAEVSSRVLGVEMVELAKDAGITPGKYNIITNLLGEELNETNANESIKDLMARYKGKDTQENGPENKSQGIGKGNGPSEKDELYNKNGKPREDEGEEEEETEEDDD